MCYKDNPSLKENCDPVKAIREALSRALGPNKKLMVDCNGVGILYVEASGSDGINGCHLLLVHVNQLIINYMLNCFLYSYFVIAILMLYKKKIEVGKGKSSVFCVKVTRLTCGGFILALRLHKVFRAPITEQVSLVQVELKRPTKPKTK
ncbi:unnamed protein product [Malus baccata var. baccata]